jgi:adenylate cyclase
VPWEVIELEADLSLIVTTQNVIDQMKRIMVSPEFSVPARAKKFLQYLVDETIAGRADRIKAYSVAIEVFGRDACFDAQNDPAVRIEAARLRRGLERYYLTAGTNDPVVISIPKGGYVPQFEQRKPPITTIGGQPENSSVQNEAAAPRNLKSLLMIVGSLAVVIGAIAASLFLRQSEVSAQGPEGITPGVIIATFEDLGTTSDSRIIALGLSSEIVDQLAKFNGITVSVGANPAGTVALSDVQLELVGSVRTSSDRLRFSVRLQKRLTKQVLWTKTFEDSFNVANLLDFEKRVASEVATELGQAHGVIIRSSAENLDQFRPEDRKAYLCTLSALAYRFELQVADHARVRKCLEETVARYPKYLAAWAQLALVYLDEDRYGYNPVPTGRPPLERATEAANQAFELDPNNIRALEVMMTISYFNGNPGLGKVMGERAMAINPNDMAVVGEYGLRLALAGEWKTGAALIERAAAYRLDNLNYYNTDLALAAYMQKDYQRAAEIINEVRAEQNPLVHLVAAAIYGQAGMESGAKISSDLLMKTGMTILNNIDMQMAKRNFREVDKFLLVEGLEKAGLPVQSAYSSSSKVTVANPN